MVDQEEQVKSSIKRALSFLEEISGLPDGHWDISAYKKALLCRMEVQYSIVVLKLTKGLNPHKVIRSSTDAIGVAQTLKQILEQPLSDKTLEGLYQVDLFLSRKILEIRRSLKARPK